jgi:hypothetical protein
MTEENGTRKIPLDPTFFKGEIFFVILSTPLWKRGEGEIFSSKGEAIIQRISDTPR